MLPDTLLGLVVFAAGAGPGYLYVRLSQVRAPRYERTALEEGVEFVVFGALASGVAVLSALALGEATGLLDTESLAKGPADYVTTEPLRSLVAFLVVISLSYGLVALITTQMLHRGDAVIGPGETAWYAAFHKFVPKDHGVYGTVELRDGRAVAGLVVSYTLEADEPREIVLSKPVDGSLWLREDDVASPLPDTFMVIQGADVYTVSGRYTALEGGQAPEVG
ncbi:MAG: DUF6338 family protein [Actinomycetota bacterium]|nr:DUF6338 family protein [Actinomycetota bacterium]